MDKKIIQQLKTRHMALGYILQIHNQADTLELPDLMSEVYSILSEEYTVE